MLLVYGHLSFNPNWMAGKLCFTSHRQRGHLETAPHLLSLPKDVKLGKYTVLTGNRTPGRRVAVHYTTASPRKLQAFDNTTKHNDNVAVYFVYSKFPGLHVYSMSTRMELFKHDHNKMCIIQNMS